MIAERGQFGEIGLVSKGFAEAGLVVVKLGLGEGDMLFKAVDV